MADSNLNSSTTAVVNKTIQLISTADADELLKLARASLYLDQGENSTIEQAMDSRIQSLITNATAQEVSKLGRAIGLMLEPDYVTIQGELIPSQTNKGGSFLSTSGTSDSWNGLITRNVNDISSDAPENNQLLVFDESQQIFIPTLPTFGMVTTQSELPSSGVQTGQIYFVVDVTEMWIWNGTIWLSCL